MKINSDLREHRTCIDRRKRKIPPLKYLLFGGRRKGIRRKEDENNLSIPDNHSSKILAIAVIILALSIIDGLFSLHLISNGAGEANLFLSYLIELNPYIYFYVKCFLTGISAIILILLRNYRSKIFGIRISTMLPIIATFFMIVISYSLYIKFQLVISG